MLVPLTVPGTRPGVDGRCRGRSASVAVSGARRGGFVGAGASDGAGVGGGSTPAPRPRSTWRRRSGDRASVGGAARRPTVGTASDRRQGDDEREGDAAASQRRRPTAAREARSSVDPTAVRPDRRPPDRTRRAWRRSRRLERHDRAVDPAGGRPAAGAGSSPRSAPTLPELRLLEDAADRESYRNDETAYLKAGLPLAVALPDVDRRGRDARPARRRASRPDRAARRRDPA